MVVGTSAVTIVGGIGVDLGVICVIANVNLIGFALPQVPEKKGRLDTEQHAGEQKCRKAELPGTDPRSQDQLGGDHRPERLREDDGEGVPQRHEEDTGELEEVLETAHHPLHHHQHLVQPLARQDGFLGPNWK